MEQFFKFGIHSLLLDVFMFLQFASIPHKIKHNFKKWVTIFKNVLQNSYLYNNI